MGYKRTFEAQRRDARLERKDFTHYCGHERLPGGREGASRPRGHRRRPGGEPARLLHRADARSGQQRERDDGNLPEIDLIELADAGALANLGARA